MTFTFVRVDLVVASAGDDKKISLWNKNGQSMGSFPSHGTDIADDIEVALCSLMNLFRCDSYIWLQMPGCHSSHCLLIFFSSVSLSLLFTFFSSVQLLLVNILE